MDRYAFYTYSFEPGIPQGDLYQEDQSSFFVLSDKKCRERFEILFGRRGVVFPIKKKDYPCIVYAHGDGIVLLRLERPKNVPIYEKKQNGGDVADIARKPTPSTPYNYIIIDFREGRNMIAVSISSDAWRDPNTVANILRESINYHFDEMCQDIHIVLQPQLIHRDYVEYSRYLIKEKQRRVTKMTFYFTGGTINPEMEAIIKNDQYLSGLNNRRFKAKHVEVSYLDPDSASIVRKNSRTLEHFVTLVMSEPDKDNFRLHMTYDDGTTLNCGRESRFEYEMKDDVFMSIFGNVSMFPEQNIGAWLDQAKVKIEEECK